MACRVLGLKGFIAALGAAVIAVAALSAVPADAAAKKRVAAKTHVETPPQPRPRSRITVQPRSFLDAGTHVQPGDRKFTDYAFPPGYSPMSVIENKGNVHRSPLPGPYWLPGGYGSMW